MRPRHICPGSSRGPGRGAFIIAKAGKPLVKVTAINSKSGEPTGRLGFMKGTMKVPDVFDRMGDDDIGSLFAGSSA